MASKQERSVFRPQYQQAQPYYAKCHSGSFPENTSSQVPRGRLHPVDKMRQKKKNALDETDDAASWRLANSKHGYHFLITYYVPGTVLSTSHRSSHLILVTNCLRASPLLFCLSSCGKSGSQDVNSLPKVKHSQEIADLSFIPRQSDRNFFLSTLYCDVLGSRSKLLNIHGSCYLPPMAIQRGNPYTG